MLCNVSFHEGGKIYSQMNIFWILFNHTEIRLLHSIYIPELRLVTNQSKMVNTIWFRVDLPRFQEYFIMCIIKTRCFFFDNILYNLWALLKPLYTIVMWGTERLQRGPQMTPMMAKDVCLSDSCTSDRL